MANWTTATTLERLGEILNDENLITDSILDNESNDDVTLGNIVQVMKDRIVRDQFTPKAKAAARKKTEPKTTGDQT